MKIFLNLARMLRVWVFPLSFARTVFCAPYHAAAAAATGGVTGSVTDDTGRPMAGSRVLIASAPSARIPISPPPVITGPTAAMVNAGGDGSFQVSGLSPGQYIACAEAAAQGFLAPCNWSASAPTFTLSAGQSIAGVTIVTPRGSIIQIQVNDPLQLLGPAAGPIDLNFEVHVVTAKGIHYSAPIQSSTAIGRTYAITVPFATPLSLKILASHFAVTDQAGKPPALAGTAVSVPAGSVPAAVVFSVTGRN